MRCILILALVAPLLTTAGLAHAEGEKKKGGGDSFLQRPGLNTMVNIGGVRRGVLMVEMGLDIPDGGLRDRAQSLQPRLRDSYLRYLTTYAAGLSPGTPPNPDIIGASLQRATDEVLGKPGAKLLIGTILEN
jgi:hypothetical protein